MKHGVIIAAFTLVLVLSMAQSQVQVSKAPPPADPKKEAGFIQYPKEMTYQGLLTTPSGIPAADGHYDLQFDLFNVAVTGSSLWSETHLNVQVTRGTFTVELGSVTLLPDLFYSILYVEVAALAGPGISGTVTFSPRTLLTASPYSLGPWLSSGYNVYRFYGNVGIGTSTPTERLEIANGNLLVGGSAIFGTGSSPMITAGFDNTIDKRMVIAHSSLYPKYGLQYRDVASDGKEADAFEFVGGDPVNPSMSFGVETGDMTLYDGFGGGRFSFLSSTGRAGFGTLSPATNVEVSGAGAQTLRLTSTDNGKPRLEFKDVSAIAPDFRLASNGTFLGISTSTDIDNVAPVGLMYFGTQYNISNENFVPNNGATFDLGTAGLRWRDVYTVNAVNSSSDERLKTDIRSLSYGIKEIMALRPVSYSWKSHPEQGTKLGLIAQEVRPFIKEIVKEGDDADKMLSMSYTELIPVLIKAVQEQQKMIQELSSQVASANTENAELRKMKNDYVDLASKIVRLEDLLSRASQTVPASVNTNK